MSDLRTASSPDPRISRAAREPARAPIRDLVALSWPSTVDAITVA
jgi:hypothetical protein